MGWLQCSSFVPVVQYLQSSIQVNSIELYLQSASKLCLQLGSYLSSFCCLSQPKSIANNKTNILLKPATPTFLLKVNRKNVFSLFCSILSKKKEGGDMVMIKLRPCSAIHSLNTKQISSSIVTVSIIILKESYWDRSFASSNHKWFPKCLCVMHLTIGDGDNLQSHPGFQRNVGISTRSLMLAKTNCFSVLML